MSFEINSSTSELYVLPLALLPGFVRRFQSLQPALICLSSAYAITCLHVLNVRQELRLVADSGTGRSAAHKITTATKRISTTGATSDPDGHGVGQSLSLLSLFSPCTCVDLSPLGVGVRTETIIVYDTARDDLPGRVEKEVASDRAVQRSQGEV